ncbi:MAG: O-antigen polysaccharide polymerase Wzy [Rhizomicrobium sp.]
MIEYGGRLTFRAILIISQTFLLLILLCLMYVAPLGASAWIVWLGLGLFYCYFAAALCRPVRIMPSIPSYMSIEILFLTFYYLLFYLPNQAYVLNAADLYQNRFLTYTYAWETNRAMIAASLGMVSFCLGLRILRDFVPSRDASLSASEFDAKKTQYRGFGALVLTLLIALILVYQTAGWHSADEGRYTSITSGGSVADGIYLLITMLCIISIATTAAKLAQRQSFGPALWLSLCIVCYWAVRILLNGDRNNFMLLAVAAGGGFLTYRFRGSRFLLVGCLFAALALYNGVEVLRMAQHRSSEALIHDIFTSGVGEDPNGSSFSISTIGLRASLAVVPSAEDFGYGRYKLIGLAGIIPFIRGSMLSDTSKFTNTAQVLSYHVLGPNPTWSVGSNIISDIYIDFGYMGIPVFMLLVGFSAGYIERWAMHNPYSVKTVTIYLMALGLYAELPRYTLDFPVRMLVWTLLLLWTYEIWFGAKHRRTALRRSRIIERWRFGKLTSRGLAAKDGSYGKKLS